MLYEHAKYDFEREYNALGPYIVSTSPRFRKETETGATGDPTKATREKGEKIVNVMVNGLAEFLREFHERKAEE